MANYRDQ